MIRLVLDTNIIISGMLWSGSPKQVLKILAEGKVQAITTEAMLDELKEVIERPKFVKRLELLAKSPQELLAEYTAKVQIIEAAPLNEAISTDPDDDVFLACAVSGKAKLIVSGDPHLLNVKMYKNIPILTAGEFLENFESSEEKK
jgi:uncharacterized protein